MADQDNKLLLCLASLNATMIVSMLKIKRQREMNKNRRSRKIWCKNWLDRRHEGKGILNLLNCELRNDDPLAYRNFLRLCEGQTDYLLGLIQDDIKKQDTFCRMSIPPRSKLEITLRFLATGETYRSLMYSTRVHESTISKFIPEVCHAIVNHLQPLYLKTPSSVEEWLNIAERFETLWQFPQCLGALDGRHVTFKAPVSDGSYYFNYKGTNSLVLLGLSDADYKFTYVNVGVNGRISDGGVFQRSNLFRTMKTNSLNFPEATILQGLELKVPYVIVTDDAFPLLPNLMKPYSLRGLDHDSKIFNYRLSRVRRIIESSFRILANRFRILLNPIGLSPAKVE